VSRVHSFLCEEGTYRNAACMEPDARASYKCNPTRERERGTCSCNPKRERGTQSPDCTTVERRTSSSRQRDSAALYNLKGASKPATVLVGHGPVVLRYGRDASLDD